MRPSGERKSARSADNTLHLSGYGGNMATMARDAWTDERLDDLKGSVDAGFNDTRSEFRAMRDEIGAGRQEMREELKTYREEMREELQLYRKESREDMLGLRAEMGALNRTIHQFMFAIVGTIFLGFMGTIAALATLT